MHTLDQIKDKELQEASEIIRALNHGLRKHILYFISKEEPVMVSRIYKTMGIEQSIASQHLSILRNAGVVKTEKDGRKRLYSIDYDRMEKVGEVIKQF